jgi:hypothetical protein
VWDDKRLDGSAFSRRTGYTPQPWEDLIALIHADQTVWEKTMQR